MPRDKANLDRWWKAYMEKRGDELRARALARYHAKKHLIDRVALAAYTKKWRAENPEKARGTKEQRRKKQARFMQRYRTDPLLREKISKRQKNPSPRRRMSIRTYCMKKKYGITEEVYQELLRIQKGCCAICGVDRETSSDKRRFPHVDHCHKTNKVRGLLCQKCNRGLGLFNDDAKRLRAAADYLERTSGVLATAPDPA